MAVPLKYILLITNVALFQLKKKLKKKNELLYVTICTQRYMVEFEDLSIIIIILSF